jgi:hypothetical protein
MARSMRKAQFEPNMPVLGASPILSGRRRVSDPYRRPPLDKADDTIERAIAGEIIVERRPKHFRRRSDMVAP